MSSARPTFTAVRDGAVIPGIRTNCIGAYTSVLSGWFACPVSRVDSCLCACGPLPRPKGVVTGRGKMQPFYGVSRGLLALSPPAARLSAALVKGFRVLARFVAAVSWRCYADRRKREFCIIGTIWLIHFVPITRGFFPVGVWCSILWGKNPLTKFSFSPFGGGSVLCPVPRLCRLLLSRGVAVRRRFVAPAFVAVCVRPPCSPTATPKVTHETGDNVPSFVDSPCLSPHYTADHGTRQGRKAHSVQPAL